MILLGVGAAVGANIALVIRSQQDSTFKQWMDEYVPGWASVVDDIGLYSKSIMEWVSQRRKDLFGSGNDPEKPVMLTKPLPTQDRSHDEPTKNEIKKDPTPLKGEDGAVTNKQDLEPVSKATSDIKESSAVKKSSAVTEDGSKNATTPATVTEPVTEPKKTEKPRNKEKPAMDTKKEDNVIAAKDPQKQQEPKPGKIEPSLVKCLEEYAEACENVANLNLMLCKAMEKARSDIALVLLQPSPDYSKLAELEKSLVETTSSLKEKVEEGYSSSCTSYQLLLDVVKDASDAGLTSLVTKAQQKMFKHAVLIQSVEDIVRINEAIAGAFNSFISTVKSTDCELSKELAALDAPADVEPGLEETAALILAEQRVKLLYDKLKQLSPEEIAKSLENHKMELAKSYEEKMQNAMDESLADMQQRIEAKVIFNIHFKVTAEIIFVFVA